MADPAGVLAVQAGDRTLAWTAVEITSAVDLSRPREYARLTVAERLRRVGEQQAAYVERMLALRGEETVSLRWLSDGGGRMRAVLLARGSALVPAAAAERAAALARRLAEVPDHLVAKVIEDEGEVRRLLIPFTPAVGGSAQVRKRIRFGQPMRQDAGVAQYLGIESFASVTADWTPLLDTIIAHRHPVAIAVQLGPAVVDPGLRRTIEYEATRYARLAKATDGVSELGARQQFPADQAAAVIAPLFDDALRRFNDRAFRFNVLVMSPAPFDDLLAEALGSTISPARSANAEQRAGQRPARATGFAVQRPGSEHEAAALQQSLWTAEPLDLPDPVMDELIRQDGGGQRAGLIRLRSMLSVDEAPQVFRLPVALEGRLPGMLVTAPRDRPRVVEPTEVASVVIGYQGQDELAADAVRIPLADLPRHAFVVGTPGSGKTNSALHLCEQLWRQEVPFLVIEPVNSVLDDYRWLATRPGFDDLLIFTVGDESVAPFRLNPFEIPAGVTVAAHVSNLMACFEAAFGLWDPLPFLYRRALVLTYRRRGLYPEYRRAGYGDRHPWPVLGEFVSCLSEVVDALGYEGEVGSNIEAASKLRAESLVEGACGPTLDCRESFDLSALLGRPIIVELAAVGDNAKEQALISLLLMNAVRAHRRAADPAGLKRPHVLMIEEAHRIFPRSKPTAGGDQKEGNAQALAAERIAQGLAEDRKYGQSYVLIDQQVGKVGEDAYKITNLKIMHRTSSEDDRKLLGATMAMHGDQLDTAATLRPFEALVSHNALDRAVTVTVPDVRARDAAARGVVDAPLADDSELRARHAKLMAEPVFLAAMAPFGECESCTHRCAFRRQAEAVAPGLASVDELAEAFESGDVVGLIEFIVSGGGVPQSVDTSAAAVLDFHVCLAIHAFRVAYPSAGWSQDDRDNACDWAALARDRLMTRTDG